MRKVAMMALLAFFIFSCKSEQEKQETTTEESVEQVAEVAYQSFGEKISDDNVLGSDELYEKYKDLAVGDTVEVKFRAKVNEVCQKKGCWMRIDLGEQESMVRFKDYGFFMPKDIAGQEVIVEAIAYVEEMSVEDQRHYAEDAGKSEDEIAQITEPSRALTFISSGVLIPAQPEAVNQ